MKCFGQHSSTLESEITFLRLCAFSKILLKFCQYYRNGFLFKIQESIQFFSSWFLQMYILISCTFWLLFFFNRIYFSVDFNYWLFHHGRYTSLFVNRTLYRIIKLFYKALTFIFLLLIRRIFVPFFIFWTQPHTRLSLLQYLLILFPSQSCLLRCQRFYPWAV